MLVIFHEMHKCKYCGRMIRRYAEHCDSLECVKKAAGEWVENLFRRLRLAELMTKDKK